MNLGTALSTMLLAACATAPPAGEAALEVEVPEVWSAGVEAAEPAGGPWWAGFGASDLDAVVEEALARNHDLEAAATAVDAALAQARIAGADLAPLIGARLDAAERQQIFVGLPIPGTGGVLRSRSGSYSTGLSISWEADLWGRLRAGEAAAVADAAALAADYQGARLSLAGQAAKAWFALVEAQQQVKLAEETADSRRITNERIAVRYRRGLVSPLDLRLARSNQAEAESALQLRRRQLDAVRRQLEILLGRYPAGRLAAEGSEQGTVLGLPGIPPPVPAGLPSQLVARRPDLRAAERRLAAAGFRVREARRALYPRLTLTGSAGTSSDGLEDLVDGDFSVWSLAGGILQPIFQGGRLRAAVDLTESGQNAALARYAQSVLRAFAEVESALAAERLLAAEETAQAAAAEEVKAAVRLAEDRYNAGLGDYLTILESQRRSFLAESRLLTVRALLLTNRVDLHLALGGDYRPTEEAVAPAEIPL